MGNVLQTITDTLGGDGRQGEARQPQSLWGELSVTLRIFYICIVQ
jgi:hypothetical protein